MRAVPHCLALLLLLAEAPVSAQVYPGGYPPDGNIGFPVPRPHKKTKKTTDADLQSIDGMLRRIESSQVILETDDHRILNCKRSDSTKFMKNGDPVKPAELKPGDHITVEANQDEEGFLTAVNVVWQQDGTAAERSQAAEPVPTSLAKSKDDRERP